MMRVCVDGIGYFMAISQGKTGRAMNSMVNQSLSEMSISELAKHCSIEMGKHRRREPSDDQFCLEIFQRAVEQHDEDAWSALYKLFSDYVHIRFHNHPCRESVLRFDSEQTYVDEAFRRFWRWATKQGNSPKFTTTAGTLTFLYLCLNSAMMDTLRIHRRSKEQPFTTHSLLNDPRLLVEDLYYQN